MAYSKIFDVELSDGRLVTLESDHEPSEDEIISHLGSNQPSAQVADPFSQIPFEGPIQTADLQMPEWTPSIRETFGEPSQPPEDATAATGFLEELRDRAGDVFRGGLQFIPSAIKAISAIKPYLPGTGGVTGDLLAGESPLQPQPELTPEQQTIYKTGAEIEQGLQGLFQPPQEPELSRSVAEGLGQVGSMLAGGAVAKTIGAGVSGAAAAATALGGVQEFDDAFTRARQRGDDPDTAFAKSLGYAGVASLIENKLGAGRIMRQFMPSAGEAAKKLTAMGVSKKILGNFVSGGVEEGAQRAAQNWIIEGEPSMEGVIEEAIPGALVQGSVSLPSAGITQPQIERKPDAVQQESPQVPGNVQQPQVTQESQVEVPAEVSGSTPAQTRVEDKDLRVTIQSPQQYGDQTVPGYVQVDSFAEGDNQWSSNPEKLKEQGYDIPSSEEFQSLPPGNYTLEEARTKLVGMGAATPSEFTPPVTFKTSNKNATIDEERKARGLPPMMAVERESNQDAWDEAMRLVDEDASVQDRLISELAEQPRALTATENALLMQRRVDLRNEYEKSLLEWRRAFESDDMVRASELSQRVKDWSNRLADLEDITKATGAESGRSLQARKMMANEDFTLATMEMQAMEAKGRSLTPEEHVELIRAHEKIAALQAKLDELESKRESVETEKSTDEILKETAKEAPKESKSKDFDLDREEKLTASIKAKVDKGQVNEITPLVQQLARLFWRRGIRTREPMIDALHATLEIIIPGFTRDQTKRAFSGYGNFTPLSKEEIDVGLRDLKGQTQQVLKMEAIEGKKPLEKTGLERRVPTDEERRLIKQVNELKRKYGVVVTDPETQLKSALQSRKTYYEHRIADLKHEIETRERIVKSKSASPTDPELQRLIEEYERLKAEHETIFVKPGMTDEQRLKISIQAAERNLAHWQVRLDNAEKGVFDKRQPGRKVTSPELEVIQAEAAAIREHVQELHDLDAAVIAHKKEAKLESQRQAVEKQIAEIENKLATGDLAGPGRQMNRPAADPELEQLLQKRDELNKALAEARKKPESQKEAEARQRELERLQKSIDEKLDKIAAGDLSTKGRKMSRPAATPELEQARQTLDSINKQIADMRKAARPKKSKEEIALQTLKTRMANRITDLKRRIATGDFTKKERQPVKLDPEAAITKAQLEQMKQEYENALERDRWNKMSVFQKTRRKAADIYDAARALMTTGEFSFILRQGKLAALSRPVMTAKALPNMFKALLASPEKSHAIDLETHSDPDADVARAAKLYLVEEPTSRLSRQEEILMGRLVGKIPVVRNFNQAAQVFLNKVRLDMFKAMRKSMSKSGTPTPEEDRQIAMFVNEATGRGGLGKLEPAGVALGRLMFAPKYYASRLQLAAGHSLWGGTMRTRRIIATEYARALVGLGLYYTALSMAIKGRDDDDEDKGKIEIDPRSTDFGTVQSGNTRLDPLAGLAQVITLGARTATGEKTSRAGEVVPIRGEDVPYGGDRWSDIVARHLRGKLHPVPASIANLFDGTDLGGNEATLINQTQNLVAPITYMDIYAALKEEGLEDGAVMALLALLGEGLRTYEEKE